ncbi:MAG TPA: 30S ribosomal protein S20 [Candidatus Paceibacterota bacterium]
MAITTSAKKAHRASLAKKVFNDRRRKEMRSAIKKVAKLVSDKKVKEAESSLSGAYKAIDKAWKRGIIKKNNAARKKSRLARLIKRGA